MKDIAFFSVLLVLFMFIMSLLGMELFANVCRKYPDGSLVLNVTAATLGEETILAPRANFDTIGDSMITVFICIIGEDWPKVMYAGLK